ncbi:MAG TPA: nucleoside triphosphate pyrophosphohydrolase, partial [Planctomycetota bacterium]|nr:nucleoside triphosphate pyrophosphohydrolase [Planctomycetota bacterium]
MTEGGGSGTGPASLPSSPSSSIDEKLESLRRLLEVVERLRSPSGCPWDRSQTVESMAPFVIEEAYEVADSIAAARPEEICEEVGDLLMVLVSLAWIAEEGGRFTLADSAAGVADKLVRRHPHVFGETKVSGVGEVLRNWETIKGEEKKEGEDRSAIAGVPRALPALLRAFRVVEKAARSGFDWESVEDAAAKVDEEREELRLALASGDRERIEDELGDLLLAVAVCGRKAGVNPEVALRRAVERFGARFRFVEARIGKPFPKASAGEV